ncbi:MAG TPA: hypothetical protein VLW65_16670 [Bryobacteraceae bacterium]|nr:hypothetical protein [Bryobacteraceae bacterium]
MYSPSNSFPAAWFLRLSIAFASALLWLAAASGQTVTVESSTGTVLNSSSIISITSSGVAPTFKVVVADVPCPTCYTDLYVLIEYFAPNGKTTYWQDDSGYVYGNGSFQYQANQEGGPVTVTYTVYNGDTLITSGTRTFTILGQQPAASSVNSQAAGAAWFFPNMINQESSDRQFNLTTNDILGNRVGYVFISSDGYGTGLSQIDPRSHTLSDADVWSWSQNLTDGAAILQTFSAGATSFWNNQISQMQSQNPGTYPVATNFAYCHFAYPQGSVHSYSDAEWITAYNGTGGSQYYPKGYFIYWVEKTSSKAGYWVVQNTVRTYVSDVCGTS